MSADMEGWFGPIQGSREDSLSTRQGSPYGPAGSVNTKPQPGMGDGQGNVQGRVKAATDGALGSGYPVQSYPKADKSGGTEVEGQDVRGWVAGGTATMPTQTVSQLTIISDPNGSKNKGPQVIPANHPSTYPTTSGASTANGSGPGGD